VFGNIAQFSEVLQVPPEQWLLFDDHHNLKAQNGESKYLRWLDLPEIIFWTINIGEVLKIVRLMA
jgi:hypothetical protein